MTIGYRGGVSIGLIVVYVPSLIIAILLATRHGFGRSGGWLFLITFSFARIIGAGFQLATITHPTISNYTAAAILTNIGFAPLELAALSLLSRLITDVNKNAKTVITTQMVKLVELILTVGVILGIIGGVNAGNNYDKTGKFVLGDENIAGTSLLLAVFALTVLGSVVISFSMHNAERGEHRIFWALIASLPFLLVRLVYSALCTFSRDHKFSLVGGSTTIVLCVALLEELAVVIIYEGVGLTLARTPKLQRDSVSTTVSTELQQAQLRPSDKALAAPSTNQAQAYREERSQPVETNEKPQEHLLVKIAKHLIFVRVTIWAVKAVKGRKQSRNEMEMR